MGPPYCPYSFLIDLKTRSIVFQPSKCIRNLKLALACSFSQKKTAPAPSKSSSGSSSGWGSSKPSNPPPQQYQAPPPAMQQPQRSGGMLSGLAGSVMQGMALGTGPSSLAQTLHFSYCYRTFSPQRNVLCFFLRKASPPPSPSLSDPPLLPLGSALAHEAVHSIFRGGSSGHASPKEATQEARENLNREDPCFKQSKGFLDCLQANNYDQGACDYFMQSLQQCQIGLKNQQQATFQ